MSKAEIHSPADIWNTASESFKEDLRLLYPKIRERVLSQNPKVEQPVFKKGVIVNVGTPTHPAILLKPNGSIKFVQYDGWSPPPDPDLHRITRQDYCALATEIIKESTT